MLCGALRGLFICTDPHRSLPKSGGSVPFQVQEEEQGWEKATSDSDNRREGSQDADPSPSHVLWEVAYAVECSGVEKEESLQLPLGILCS